MKTRNNSLALTLPPFQQSLNAHQQDTEGFLKLSALLKEKAGINLPLSQKNLSLMAGRLNSLLQRQGIDTYARYYKILEKGDPNLLQEFISALTTNTTEFFREPNHFKILSEILPKRLAEKGPEAELRLWCAASSTGQEPYTLLITILETLGENFRSRLKMLATDIDREVLERASRGIYSADEMRGLSAQQRQHYFISALRGKEQAFQMKEHYRDLIRFAPLNLIQPSFPFQHPFDVIFCRNVLIYFDRETTEALIERMAAALAPGGYLFIGHAEGGMMRSNALERVSHAVYRKRTR